ncbi:hypothetical protein F0U44_01995 [Nocardioides humilatus]|uniref:Calcium-binding protein n=1 Tax=Nocardioides humilatus TaxID=2607660 RepID=A0A5B1LM02_9ACTN|nr:hypothetical protein [Nocardioides humilatus]KAA1421118.1 hypothetical protein F0U44_01995 [Nocardioides humilatus]
MGTQNDDFIWGTDGDDVIVGLSGDDEIYSFLGNDTVCGNSGEDASSDLGGDDVFIGGDGDDVVIGGRGDDIVRLGRGADHFEAWDDAEGYLQIFYGPGDDRDDGIKLPVGGTVNGGPGDDVIGVETVPDVPMSFVGGDGRDEGILHVDDSTGTAAMLLSQRTAEIRVGAGPVGRYSGWEETYLFGNHDWVYRGTNGHEGVTAVDGSLRARLYGGSDYAYAPGDRSSFVDGGAGYDYADGGSRAAPLICVSIEVSSCDRNR